MKTGVLVVNLGTPDTAEPEDVGRYLKEFLNDPFVIDIPTPLRWILVNLLIVPRRKHQSSEAYKTIWTDRGSPLKFHLLDLVANLKSLSANTDNVFEMAMRYGSPSIESAVLRLKKQDVSRVLVVPLYPQFAESSTQSTIEEVKRSIAKLNWRPQLRLVRHFFSDTGHADVWTHLLLTSLREFGVREQGVVPVDTHVLFSYHGLPERHLLKAEAKFGKGDPVCLDGGKASREESLHRKYECCERAIANQLECLQSCYRAQSLATTKAIVESLARNGVLLSPAQFSMSFQSRLGRTPWIRPYTDDEITALAKAGVRHLVVLTPSFVADCLETIEEIGDRARHQFLNAGGREFTRVSCPNAHPMWVSALLEIIDRTLAE